MSLTSPQVIFLDLTYLQTTWEEEGWAVKAHIDGYLTRGVLFRDSSRKTHRLVPCSREDSSHFNDQLVDFPGLPI